MIPAGKSLIFNTGVENGFGIFVDKFTVTGNLFSMHILDPNKFLQDSIYHGIARDSKFESWGEFRDFAYSRPWVKRIQKTFATYTKNIYFILESGNVCKEKTVTFWRNRSITALLFDYKHIFLYLG